MVVFKEVLTVPKINPQPMLIACSGFFSCMENKGAVLVFSKNVFSDFFYSLGSLNSLGIAQLGYD